MEVRLGALRKSEEIGFQLRALYEQYGYEKFRMGKFEEYDFYTENKDFLASNHVLTFTDLSGKLMALKPDVTMSIVKRTRATMQQPERLYYNESIYRASEETREYKEIEQIGAEYIGRVSQYTNIEMVELALKSLASMEKEYMLDISHMGFVAGLFEEIQASKAAKRTLLSCIETKNAHSLQAALEKYEIPQKDGERLLALLPLCGPLQTTLKEAEKLVANLQMEKALAEMEALRAALQCYKDVLCLDFSITLGSKYYNGLMLRGYIKSVPRAILSGGRYDLLLRRMGIEELEAIGFAVYLNEVERYLKDAKQKSYDAVILYDESTPPAHIRNKAEALVNEGKRIYVNMQLPESGMEKKTQIYRYRNGIMEETNA